MRTATKHLHDLTLANGDEIELEAGFPPSEHHEVIVVEKDDLIVMGYLSHDQYCENPLESCCAMGSIHHHPRSRYGNRKSEYYDALALDSYGDPIIDEDKLQQMWHDKVMALPLELFTLPEKFFADDEAQRAWRILNRGVDATLLRQKLADETTGDYSIISMCRDAWRRYDLPDLLEEELADRIEDKMTWEYQDEADKCLKPGDPDAVLLDLYDHSGCYWSLSGQGMNCRWDTSRHESVWVPDNELRKYLDEIKDPVERWKQAKVYAQQAVDLYNAWTSGDCNGVVVQTHDKAGEMIESDECWGYLMLKYASDTLLDTINHMIKDVSHEKNNPNG